MKTNTENLQAAITYWHGQHEISKLPHSYVVASPSGLRVLTNDMNVMLSGCALPRTFLKREEAGEAAASLLDHPLNLDQEPRLQAMTYERFCEIQLARFEIALHTTRVADAMAYQNEAA